MNIFQLLLSLCIGSLQLKAKPNFFNTMYVMESKEKGNIPNSYPPCLSSPTDGNCTVEIGLYFNEPIDRNKISKSLYLYETDKLGRPLRKTDQVINLEGISYSGKITLKKDIMPPGDYCFRFFTDDMSESSKPIKLNVWNKVPTPNYGHLHNYGCDLYDRTFYADEDIYMRIRIPLPKGKKIETLYLYETDKLGNRISNTNAILQCFDYTRECLGAISYKKGSKKIGTYWLKAFDTDMNSYQDAASFSIIKRTSTEEIAASYKKFQELGKQLKDKYYHGKKCISESEFNAKCDKIRQDLLSDDDVKKVTDCRKGGLLITLKSGQTAAITEGFCPDESLIKGEQYNR